MPMLSEIAGGGRGSFDVRGVRYGVHTYEYRDRSGINKQGKTFVVTFVGIIKNRTKKTVRYNPNAKKKANSQV